VHLNEAYRDEGPFAQRTPVPFSDVVSDVDGRYESALADLGSLALNTHDAVEVERAAVAILQALLDMDLVLILRRLPQQNALLLENGVDAEGWLEPGALIPMEADTRADVALHSQVPVVIEDLAVDGQFQSLPFVGEHAVSSGIFARISGEGDAWGLLAAFSKARMSFATGDLHFVRAVSNAIAWAVTYSRARRTFESLIEDSPDPVARFDSQLRVEYANTALVLAVGIPAKELLGRSLRDLSFMEPQLDGLEALGQAVFRSKRERQADFYLASPLGERYYHVRLIPEFATDGSVRSVLVIARDNTEYKKVDDERAALQQELIEQDRRHQELVQRLLVEQQRSKEHQVDATVRSEIIRQLTTREKEILRLLAGGLTNRQIAWRLHLSAGTVRNHLGRVFPKLEAVDRTQAAVRAVELGLIDMQEAA
jgi:PAS domain S-box-containing protein